VALTAAGYTRFRPVGPGSRIALVAPASPTPHHEVEPGIAELRRLGFEPVWDERIFERHAFVAGTAASRTAQLQHALTRPDVDAVIAVRGGYGSVQTLAGLDVASIRLARTAFIGYSDVTSVHAFLGQAVGLASVHGPMIDRRLSHGPAFYDPVTFLASLSTTPIGELTAPGLEVVKPGEARGAFVGGTLTQLTGLIGTPFDFVPPTGHILFIDEVHERPYRLHRLLTHWRMAGRLTTASALVFGQLPHCDEPNGAITAIDVVREFADDFPGPVVFGLPMGHTTSPLLSAPLGVDVRVIASARAAVVFTEAAAHA
jgi:muramoyltetrapeptide carboxypeptidase